MSIISFQTRYNQRPHSGLRSAFSQVLERLNQIWWGPPGLPVQLRMEQRFVALRYMSVLFVAPVLPLLDLSVQQLVAAYTLLFFFFIYNFGVQTLIRRHSIWISSGYITSVGDGFSTIMMVFIGGGFNSAFYMTLFGTTVAIAMRYGYGLSMLVAGTYILLDGVSPVIYGTARPGTSGDFFFRSGFLVLVAFLGSYLRAQAYAAEVALAQQLNRASALNESTRALNASLQLDTVVRAVAAEARRLMEAEAVALKLDPEFSGRTVYDLSSLPSDDLQPQACQMMLNTLLAANVSDDQPAVKMGLTVDGRWYIVAPLQNRGGMSGYIAVMRAKGQPAYAQPDAALLTSFIDRAILAIENAGLYKTIGDRRQELQRAYAELATAHQELLCVDEMKTNFIANVSHELRTPLTSVRSFSELLLSFEVDDTTEREFLEIINTESERLTRLINDVLDITKIESGQVAWHMKQLNLADLLQISARTFAPLVEKKGLQFELVLPDRSVQVCADSDRVLQVLANLLGNAMKFTPQGTITLSAEVAGDVVLIHVRDTGIGIAPADHERIFEKFQQVGDTLTEKPTGTGLGLCICHDIVLHHGGELWVDSELGQGSTFSFSLPIASSPVLIAA